MTPLIEKFQRAVRKAIPRKMSLVDAVKMALIKEQAAARRRKEKNKLQKIVRKHFFGQNKNRLDLDYIVKVVHLHEKLQILFKH